MEYAGAHNQDFEARWLYGGVSNKKELRAPGSQVLVKSCLSPTMQARTSIVFCICAHCEYVLSAMVSQQKKKRCAAEESSSCKVLPLPYDAGARDISQGICCNECEVHEPLAERVAKNHVLPSRNMLRQSDLRGLREHLVRFWLSFS